MCKDTKDSLGMKRKDRINHFVSLVNERARPYLYSKTSQMQLMTEFSNQIRLLYNGRKNALFAYQDYNHKIKSLIEKEANRVSKTKKVI